VPFGRASTDDRPARDAAAAAGVLAAAGLGWAGWRRRNLLVAALGGMSVAASLAAVWSTTRIVGEALPYLLVWAGVLLLPAWIGLGLLLHRPPAPGRTESSHQARSGLAVVAVALGVTLAWSMLRAPLPPVPSDPDVPALAGLARLWLTEHGARQVRVHIGEHDRWPLAAGVINRLEKDGVDVTVDPEWTPILGDQFRPTGREPAEIWLTGPAATPPVSGRERLGALASASVWAGPLADKGQS